ncbi:MAG: pseudaminic acid synthase [Chthoniobacterales bacterium]
MGTHIEIAGRKIGEGEPCYIIAELSANHGQDYTKAEELVRVAKECGADAVKLQTFTPETMTLDLPGELFEAKSKLWKGRRLFEIYQEASMPWEWQPKLKKFADSLGIHLFSSPFDATAVDFLEKMNAPAYKIASFELTDLPLIRKSAATGMPLIMSVGMATLEEISDAVDAAVSAGCKEYALLRCTSAYPSPASDMNLRTIPHLAQKFQCPAGLSDHTLGFEVPIAAVAAGASIIEKHFILSRAEPSLDGEFSLEPDEFARMVSAIRAIEPALGTVHYGPTKADQHNVTSRRSLFVVEDIDSGELITEKNIRSIRPGTGLAPKHLEAVIGRKTKQKLTRGTPLSWEHLT